MFVVEDVLVRELLRLAARVRELEDILADQGRVYFLHGPAETHEEQAARVMRAHGQKEARIAALEAEIEEAHRLGAEIEARADGRVREIRDQLAMAEALAARRLGTVTDLEAENAALRELLETLSRVADCAAADIQDGPTTGRYRSLGSYLKARFKDAEDEPR